MIQIGFEQYNRLHVYIMAAGDAENKKKKGEKKFCIRVSIHFGGIRSLEKWNERVEIHAQMCIVEANYKGAKKVIFDIAELNWNLNIGNIRLLLKYRIERFWDVRNIQFNRSYYII